jgi:hypothetical protein
MHLKTNPTLEKQTSQPKQKALKQTSEQPATKTQSADQLPVSIDDQLERFADILLDIYLTQEHEARQNN